MCLGKCFNRVLKPQGTDRSPRININIESMSSANKAGKKRTLFVHHAILHALDPTNELFECSQKLTAYRGYVKRDSGKFVRPEDHCYQVQEVLDEDGDNLLAVCKTDGDHMLGYVVNNIFCLWKCNHQVNRWFHQIRQRAGKWLHPYYDVEYGDGDDELRVKPPYFDSLPPTLTPSTRGASWEKYYELLLQYREEKGHTTNVPQSYKPDPKLGTWVNTQRHRYKRNTINTDQVDRLNAIQFEWVIKKRKKQEQE